MQCSRSFNNMLLVSVSFCIIFCAYNTLQNYATSLFPQSFYGLNWNLGNVSLAILYGSVGLTVFLSPALVNRLGSRWTMLLGGICYVAYMISLINIIPAVVMFMSFVIGFGAAILWIALGVFITQNSTPATYGSNTGLFWSIFQVCQVLGNLATYLVFQHLDSNVILYIGFSVIATVGTAGLFFLRKPLTESGGGEVTPAAAAAALTPASSFSSSSPSALPSSSPNSCSSLLREIRVSGYESLKLLWTPKFMFLIVAMFFSGLELSFWTGEFPQLFPPTVIGLVLTFAGVGEVIGGYCMGKLCDWAGQGTVMVVGTILYGTGLALSAVIKQSLTFSPIDGSVNPSPLTPTIASVPLHAYAAALLFGLGDSAFNTSVWSITSLMFDKKSSKRGGGGGSSKNSLNDSSSSSSSSSLNYTAAASTDAEALLMQDEGYSADDGADADDDAVTADTAVEARTHSVSAFTTFQLVQNLGSGVGFFYAIALPMHGEGGTFGQIWTQVALMLTGTALMLIGIRLYPTPRSVKK